MSFLIDTDIASAYVRGVGIVQNRFLQYTGGLHISTVTLAELTMWLLRRNTPAKYMQEFAGFQQQIHLLDVDSAAAQKAGEVGAGLLDSGLTVATPDLLIAATALVHNLTLVTHNTQDYVNVPGLPLVDWLVP
jgi:predicted nucleic acid-binding protein